MTEEKMIYDELKPHHERREMAVELPPELLQEVSTARIIGEMLLEEGVEYNFGITAGAEWAMEMAFARAGIKRVHVRHEQTAVFAAEAMGRVQGTKPGFCLIGPCTGLTNSTSGVLQAYSAQSPTVIITGEHPMFHDRLYSGQGIAQTEYLYSKICKSVKRAQSHPAVLYEIKRAFRDAVTPPTGPCAVAVPIDLTWVVPRQPRVMYYTAYTPSAMNSTPSTADVARVQADPALIDKTMKWLMEAEKPALIAGEGVSYDDAEPELQEFVKLTGIPTHCRRNSRGAIDEYDPLNCYGRARGRVMRTADRAIAFALRIAFLEFHGMPPFWGGETKHVQMQSCKENVCLQLINSEWEVVGSPKLMLRQMIDWCKANGITKPPEKWNDWRKFVEDTKEHYYRRTIERTEKQRGIVPLHPDLAGRIMSEFLHEELNENYISIIDGFTASSYFTDWQRVRHSRHNLDASDTIGIGHSPGMAIGGALATKREKPLLAVMGDGAIGAGGMDIETAVRWNIPCVFLHENNSTMVTGGWKLFWSKTCTPTGDPLLDSWQTLPNIRYDRMMKEFGCHTEFAEKDVELAPAMKRAFDYVRSEGKPAFVEVFVDPDVLQEIWGSYLVAITLTELEWDEVPEEGKKAILDYNLMYPDYIPMTTPSVQKVFMPPVE